MRATGCRSGIGLHRWARPVRRQVDRSGRFRELFGPVARIRRLFLGRAHRLRSSVLAEQQHWPEIRLSAFTQVRVNLRQFRDDNVDRPAVADDVMGGQHKRVRRVRELEQPRPNRRPFDEVERP